MDDEESTFVLFAFFSESTCIGTTLFVRASSMMRIATSVVQCWKNLKIIGSSALSQNYKTKSDDTLACITPASTTKSAVQICPFLHPLLEHFADCSLALALDQSCYALSPSEATLAYIRSSKPGNYSFCPRSVFAQDTCRDMS